MHELQNPPVESRSLADPRPVATVESQTGTWRVSGGRCQSCGTATLQVPPRCPVCRGDVEPALHGPTGKVYASTVVHLDAPGIVTPYTLAYVDLDDGPRALAHVVGAAVEVGREVRLIAPSGIGNLRVEGSA